MRRYVRRITLERPGAEAVVLVTDLLDGAKYPAADLLAVYLCRWGIDTAHAHCTASSCWAGPEHNSYHSLCRAA
jgi:hypothetical protein